MAIWPTDTAPTGWVLCDGASLVRTGIYAGLFAAIGVTFGEPDGTHFNVPDLRGRVPLGKDNMGGTSANRVTAAAADSLAGSGGEENHALIEAELAAHHHHVLGRTNNGNNGSEQAWVQNADTNELNATSTVGSGTAHNTMQPYLTLNYIIKL